MDKFSNDSSFVYLDRNSALPLYYQLKEHIKDAILKGHYKPNDRLPTEEELCKQFSISRPVVRQAYDELIKEGFVGRRKGSGTFVKKQTETNSLFKEFISFSFEKSIPDLVNNSKIVKIEKIHDSNVCARMKIDSESELVHIIRVYHESEYPIATIESYLPSIYFANLEKYILVSMEKTIIEIIEMFYAIQIKKAKRQLSPMKISEERMAFLHGNSDDLVYEIETIYIDIFDRIAILEYYTCLTSNFQFSVEMNRK